MNTLQKFQQFKKIKSLVLRDFACFYFYNCVALKTDAFANYLSSSLCISSLVD